MIRDEYRNYYNEVRRAKLEEIARDCATAIALITPRLIASDKVWTRRSMHARDTRAHTLRAVDAR